MGNWVSALQPELNLFIYILFMMIRLFYYGVILLVLFCSCNSKSMSKEELAKNDSIKKYLKLAGNDTLDFKLRDKFNDKAFSFVDLNKNDTLTRSYLSDVSFNYMGTLNKDLFNKIAKIHYEKSSKSNDTLNLARYYRYKAGYFKNTFINDSSLYYYIKAEKFYKKTNDELGLAIVYQNKGDLQYDNYDCLGAEILCFKAYYIYKKNNNKERIYAVLNQLGLIYIEFEDFDKAKKCFDEALDIVNDFKTKNNFKAILVSNIGLVFHREKKYIEAIKQYEMALKMIENKGNHMVLYSNILNNLVECKLVIHDYENLSKLLFESLRIRKEIKEPSAIIRSLIDVSQYYYSQGNTVYAKKYAEEAFKKAQMSQNKSDYLEALRQNSNIDRNYIDKYYKEYIRINDSFQLNERKTRNNFTRIQLEKDDLAKEKDIAIQQKWIVASISTIIVFVIILLLIITRQLSKQKELQMLQSQQKSNEEIYDLMLAQKNKEELARESEKKRIAIELHDNVMNRLASIRLNLNVLSNKNDKETIEKCLTHINEIHSIENEIRNISHNLNQEVFGSNNSFENLIYDFVNMQNETSEINFSYEIQRTINWEEITSEIKMNLYRIIQESSYNINKFSKAKEAVISILLDGKNICLSISDNGKGFNVEIQTDGIGLKNIRQRVKSLDGRFLIQSVEGKSTSLNISIPIRRS